MENRRVWLFYAVVVSLWIAGFAFSATRIGQASGQRHESAAVSATRSPSTPLATRN